MEGVSAFPAQVEIRKTAAAGGSFFRRLVLVVALPALDRLFELK